MLHLFFTEFRSEISFLNLVLSLRRCSGNVVLTLIRYLFFGQYVVTTQHKVVTPEFNG